MARSINSIKKALTLTVSTQTVDILDITNYSGAASTIKTPVTCTGSMFYEWCNQNSSVDADWKAVPTAQYPNATVTLTANNSYTLNVHGLHVGFLRVRVTLTTTSGAYDVYSLMKDF